MVVVMQERLHALSREAPPRESLQIFAPSQARRSPPPDSAPQLVAVNNGADVVALTAGNSLTYANLRSEAAAAKIEFSRDDGTLPSRAPLVESIPAGLRIRELLFDATGDRLLIYGDWFLGVLLLPRRDRYGRLISAGGLRDSAVAADALAAGEEPPQPPFHLVDLSGPYVDGKHQRIVQAAWHPLCSECVTVLTVPDDDGGRGRGGGTVELHLHDYRLAEPAQSLNVRTSGASAEPQGEDLSPVSFCFGSPQGWQRFAIWVLTRGGTIMLVCPVLPVGAALRRSDVVALLKPIRERLAVLKRRRGSRSGDFGGAGGDVSPLRLPDANMLEGRTEASEISVLEQRRGWLVSVFGVTLVPRIAGSAASDDEGDEGWEEEEGGEEDEEEVGGDAELNDVIRDGFVDVGQSARRRLRGGTSGSGSAGLDDWVCVAGPAATHTEVALQGNISGPRDSPAGSDGSAACRLACVLGAAAAVGPAAATGAFEVLARVYVSGVVDILLAAGGAVPRWAKQDRETDPEGYTAPVLECLNVAGDSSSGTRASFAPNLMPDPRLPWTFHVVAPHAISSVYVAWAEKLERFVLRSLQQPGSGSALPGETPLDRAELKKLLGQGREDSAVVNLLYVVPEGGSWSTSPPGAGVVDDRAVVGAAVVCNPAMGHLLLARLASGTTELVNVRVRHGQAAAEAIRLKQWAASEARAPPAMFPPFGRDADELLEQARGGLDQYGYALNTGAASAKLSVASTDVVSLLSEGTLGRVDSICEPLWRLEAMMRMRLKIMQVMHAYQARQAEELQDAVMRLQRGQAQQRQLCAGLIQTMQNLAERAAGALEQVQRVQPRLTRAERQFRTEVDRRNAQTARWQDAVGQMRQQAGLDEEESGVGGGAGGGVSRALHLSPDQEKWTKSMLMSNMERMRRSIDAVAAMTEELKRLRV